MCRYTVTIHAHPHFISEFTDIVSNQNLLITLTGRGGTKPQIVPLNRNQSGFSEFSFEEIDIERIDKITIKQHRTNTVWLCDFVTGNLKISII